MTSFDYSNANWLLHPTTAVNAVKPVESAFGNYSFLVAGPATNVGCDPTRRSISVGATAVLGIKEGPTI